MKQRFSSLDVRVIAHELSVHLVSLRLSNIYDLSTRIFLLKFAKPDHREQLIIDSGFRCHLTSFARATAAAPTPFVARLRKFLKTRRVTRVAQVGTDRVIEIEFSDGAYRLFLEFYAGGNIILTDADLTILSLLRTVTEGTEEERIRAGSKYDLSIRQNYAGVPPLTRELVKAGLMSAVERQRAEASKPGKKVKKKPGDSLRKALAVTTTQFPPILIDHALHVTHFDRETPPENVVESDDLLDALLRSLLEAQRIIEELTSEANARGYILAKRAKPASKPDPSHEDDQNTSGLLYDDFHPFKPAQYAVDESITFIEHEGFNKTVDDFFSSIEGQKLESRLQEREDHARKKIDQARKEQQQRIGGLQQVQELNVRKAQAIEANVERVEEAAAAVNGLIAQGMDWVDIGHLIENEQARANPVAQTIKLPLKLEENTVTLLLSEMEYGTEEIDADVTDSEASDSEDEDQQAARATKTADARLTVDIDLALSAWSNAREYYDQKRNAAVKQDKTQQASEKALKSTEKKVMADLKKGLKTEKELLRPVRKQLWFEKFIYFLSSDGYLVLAGKDITQNELLYRRYLKKGDVYLHADVNGAASVIVKNHPTSSDAPIPPSTLSQAGCLAVCTSTAWDSKAGMSAWWVNADQVSKTAPTGEYLSEGGFMIRGKKNFLPPAQLLLGFAVAFQISEESKAQHVKHRLRDGPGSVSHGNGGHDVSANGDDGEDNDEDDDDDDEFPDVPSGPNGTSSTGLHNNMKDNEKHVETDEDDDEFPDAAGLTQPREVTSAATIKDDSEDEDDDEDESTLTTSKHVNPLQNDARPVISGEEEGDEDESDDDIEDQTNPDRDATTSIADGTGSISQSTASKKPLPRGKRTKAKKAARKYAGQDDEDRELAMQFLGSRAEAKKQAEAEARAAKEETQEEARARRRAQHERKQKAGLEAEELRRLNLEDGIDLQDEDEAANLAVLETLVGTPLAGDEILDAIPICAPWAALSKYKYKVKLQPGQQKKGKAIREIMGRWAKDASDNKKIDSNSQDIERIWPREAELIKNLKDVEIVGVIPVKNVRVMTGGGGGGGDKSKSGKTKGKGGSRKKGK